MPTKKIPGVMQGVKQGDKNPKVGGLRRTVYPKTPKSKTSKPKTLKPKTPKSETSKSK